MTLFGHDVSSYNPDYHPSAGEFVIIKASEGAHTHDSSFGPMLARARAAGAIPLAYHFLHADSTPQAQAQNLASVPGIKGIPVMVDVEQEGSSFPNIAQCAQFTDACRALGLTVKLVYLPHWYWQQIGSPGLTALSSRGLSLVSSAYPGGSGYPGDGGSGWASYGGMTPVIWQYTDRPVDGDAFKGTAAQLHAILGTTPGVPPKKPVPAPGTTSYTVKDGDTLSGIATAHGLTLAQIEHLNPQITNPDVIAVGEVIHLVAGAAPAHPTYTVQEGDTLSAIAEAHGTSVEALAALNHLSNPNRILVGQILELK